MERGGAAIAARSGANSQQLVLFTFTPRPLFSLLHGVRLARRPKPGARRGSCTFGLPRRPRIFLEQFRERSCGPAPACGSPASTRSSASRHCAHVFILAVGGTFVLGICGVALRERGLLACLGAPRSRPLLAGVASSTTTPRGEPPGRGVEVVATPYLD